MGVPSPHDALWRGLDRCSVADSAEDAFQLPALTRSVAEARRRVLRRLREWNVRSEVRHDAQLVMSELFTNAVRHTGSRRVHCDLRLSGDRIRLEVADQGRAGTEPRPVTGGRADQEGGRGLFLVDALCDTWGVRPDRLSGGRIVWAVLPAGVG